MIEPHEVPDLVDRLREEYAEGCADNDGVPTDDGFVAWLAVRVDNLRNELVAAELQMMECSWPLGSQ